MNRSSQFGKRDTPIESDGDVAILGFRSRVPLGKLPPGIARFLGNTRCNRGTFRPRKGTKALSTDLTLVNPALILNFTLAPNVPVTSITRAGGTATVTTTGAHGYSTGNYVNIAGAAQAEYNGDFTITVTSPTVFTYAVTGTPASPATGTIIANRGPRIYTETDDAVRGSCGWTSTSNGEGIVLASTLKAYLYREGSATATLTYPAGETVQSTDVCSLEQFLDKVFLFRGYQTAAKLTVSSITRVGATATVTTATAHGQITGAWVTIVNATGSEYNGVFQITVTGASTFTYAVTGAPTSPDPSLTMTARPCKIPLYWAGDPAAGFLVVTSGYHATGGTIIHMPAADWGLQIDRRLLLPYGRDQFILSDLGDADSYDKQYGQMRVRPGASDWFVAASAYQLSRTLILYRKSLHLLVLDGSLAISAVQEITRDLGCLARRTIANCGSTILWLSDLGVHGVQIQSDLSLTPLELPLSEPIQDIIDTINWTYASKAVARFFDNRYYLAVPTGTSTKNNSILVFNFLNRSQGAPFGEWESVDTFQGNFDVQDFHVLDNQGRKRLHVATTYGFVFLMEELELDQWGSTASIGSYAIAAVLLQRYLYFQTLDTKRFLRAQVESSLTAGDAFTVNIVTLNPDTSREILDYEADATDDVSHSPRTTGVRGVAAALEITTSAGRPEISALLIDTAANQRNNLTRV